MGGWNVKAVRRVSVVERHSWVSWGIDHFIIGVCIPPNEFSLGDGIGVCIVVVRHRNIEILWVRHC